MAKLTEGERKEVRRVAARVHDQPPLSPEERFVAPTPEARLRYIRGVSQASKFFFGEKPFALDDGGGWRL